MGWMLRLAAAFVGLVSFGVGLWPVGVLCVLYLAVSFRPRGSKKSTRQAHISVRLQRRHVLAVMSFALSAMALASGGITSPVVFFSFGMVVLMWPRLQPRLPFSEVVPIRDSVLLRPKYFPVAWCALAELKPGAEDFPRALSSFAGTLLVFSDTGKAYAIARCHAFGRKEAESKLLSQFRSSAPRTGAYLLPLDATAACEMLRLKLQWVKLPPGDLAESASRVSGLLVLECGGGTINRGASFEFAGRSRSSVLASKGSELDGAPLTWEVLDSVGKRTKWPDPDSFSNLLDSITATRGVPVAERIRAMEGSGGQLTVQSLSGEEVQLSRSQLRAILSIYS